MLQITGSNVSANSEYTHLGTLDFKIPTEKSRQKKKADNRTRAGLCGNRLVRSSSMGRTLLNAPAAQGWVTRVELVNERTGLSG